MNHRTRTISGFTLLEVVVVAGITVVITSFLIANFSRSRLDLNQVALTITDAIREAQSQALSGSLVRGTHRCGYGIHFMSDSYLIYAGPDTTTVDCASDDRNYNEKEDTVIRTALLENNSLELVLPIPDIFFEPPDPTTYIGGESGPKMLARIVVQKKGKQGGRERCPNPDCRLITVTGGGSIQTQ